MTIDLHMHTNASDGLLTARELLVLVREARLLAFSITDHDTLEGYRAALKLLEPDDPELISGVELSVQAGEDDMHMLAYLFDPDNADFNAALTEFLEARNRRGRRIVEKLRDMGLSVPFSAVEQEAGNSAMGRPHIAAAMLKVGAVKSIEEAFYRYIGNGKPAYMPKSKLSPGEAIELIHGAGGVAVMAHPMIAHMYKHIEDTVKLGLDGIEAYHYSHSRPDIKQLKKTAERFGLLTTGGSDFHGRSEREGEIGSQQVPTRLLAGLRARAEQIRGEA